MIGEKINGNNLKLQNVFYLLYRSIQSVRTKVKKRLQKKYPSALNINGVFVLLVLILDTPGYT